MMTMMVEAAGHQDQEEAVMGFQDQSQMMIIKGKRTKRQRLASPLAALTTAASSSSSAGHDRDHDHQHQGLLVGPSVVSTDDVGPTETSPATSADQFTEISKEEEEDMANCLILLAQGNSTPKPQTPILVNKNKASASSSAAAGLYLYQCKTCGRCFPSFQALGGHRASHKKPNKANMMSTQDNKKTLSFLEEVDEYDRFNNTSTTLSLQISNRAFRAVSSVSTTPNCNNNKANKIHECSVCGAEFTSGQALGGHMRRHRTFINTTTAAATTAMSSPQSQSASKRPRNVLQLDLNLPAPEEDRIETKFPFGAKKEQVIVFSASPLVGCHY